MRERIDQLKARADLPRYKYATDDQPKLIAYFLKRAVQFGEAAFRTRIWQTRSMFQCGYCVMI